jgi:hypothetical protein
VPQEVVVSTREVYVHVGLPKSGTTYLQRAMRISRDALAEQGVLFPGTATDFQRQAAWDLLGRRLRGVDQSHLPGSWRRLVNAVQEWDGDKVVISEEFLVHARERHIRRLQRDFSPAQLHVVVTVRDLERTIRSMWQQELAMSRTWTLAEFLTAVREPASGSATAGVRFWLRFDLDRILRTWASVVPPERIHIVVVPPPGTPAGILAERFAEAIGLEPGVLTLPEEPVNTSVGIAEAEVLRRLNSALGGRLDDRQYVYLMKHVIRPALRQRSGVPIRIPKEDLEWIRERGCELADVLKSRPYHVVGDRSELVPPISDDADEPPEGVQEAAIADAALSALSVTMEHYARHGLKISRRGTGKASAVTKVASSARALTFKARFGVLESADKNRVASKAANLYLRRLSRNR